MCPNSVYFGPQYLHRDYFKAKVYSLVVLFGEMDP